MQDVLVMVLAGGRGSRLMPLTDERAKPAVPFGGRYRLIDFVLSNFVNSGFFKIVVLTQYKSQSLNKHLLRAWRLSRTLDQYVEPVPAQQRTGLDWYRGSADAIFQNLNLIDDERPRDVAVFGADHIYKMEIAQMVHAHRQCGAAATIAAMPMPIEEAHAFGVIVADASGRIIGFEEKPARPTPMPGRPDMALVSMGNYLFRTSELIAQVTFDSGRLDTAYDFGANVLPYMLATGAHLQVYDFLQNRVPGAEERDHGYWRDVGTIRSYYDASMDLIGVTPALDLYNRYWPVRTDYQNYPPAKFVHAEGDRTGVAVESMVSDGCIISGGRIERSLLSPRVRVNSYSSVEGCILMEGVQVGRYARIRRAIVDKNVDVPTGARIGFDPVEDAARGFTVTEDGITVVPKDARFHA